MWQQLEMANADVRLRQDFLPERSATALFGALLQTVAWRSDSIKLFGRSRRIPRLHQWYADSGLTYKWSGLTMLPQPWLPELTRLRTMIERATGTSFNSVLINLYRDGADSMGWHADDEPELGDQPVIASLSLGAERDFVMRRRERNEQNNVHKKQCIQLTNGCLLLMQGDTQRFWHHALPKRRKITNPRINLTFRLIQKQMT